MRRKIVILIGIVIILAIVVAAANFVFRGEKEEMSERELQELAAPIIAKKNFDECDRIPDAQYRTVCVNNIALALAAETQDIAYCEKIDNMLVSREGCERDVVLKKSVEQEDIAVCGEATSETVREQCGDNFYIGMALRKDDGSFCDRLGDKAKADFCHDQYVVLKKFGGDAKNFDCSSLRIAQDREDCEYVRKSFGETGTAPRECRRQLRGSLFLQFCL